MPPVTPGPPSGEPGNEHTVIGSQDSDDTTMPPTSVPGKTTTSDKPPTTPHRQKKRSTSATDKWWLKLRPMALAYAPTTWNDEILEAVVAEWDSTKWGRLIAWTGEWCDPHMCATARGLRSSCTPSRTLKSGLNTVLRAYAMPPQVLGAHPPRSPICLAAASSPEPANCPSFGLLPATPVRAMEVPVTETVDGPNDDAGFDDEIMETQRVLGVLQHKLGFATHILDAALLASQLCDHLYQPLSLPHCPPTVMLQDYGLQSYQLRLFAFATAASDVSILHSPQRMDSVTRTARHQCSPTRLLAASAPPPPPGPFPPTFVMQYIQSTLGAVNVWAHAPALYNTVNKSLNDTWQDLTSFPNDAVHFLTVTTDSPGYRPPVGHLWLLHPPSSHAPLPHDALLLASTDFHNTRWALYGCADA